MRLVHKRRRRGCGSRSPEGERAPALALSQSNRFVKKPSHSRSGRLQELKLFALLAQHFRVEVAVGLDPILVDFDREGANKS